MTHTVLFFYRTWVGSGSDPWEEEKTSESKRKKTGSGSELEKNAESDNSIFFFLKKPNEGKIDFIETLNLGVQTESGSDQVNRNQGYILCNCDFFLSL